MGKGLPIILQSMTSTATKNIEATVEQVIRIVDAGAHMVRVTAQNTNEAKNLSLIKQELKKRSYDIPLVADIHFNPKAADIAATIVEKVRINPGNYVDKKSSKTEWTDEEYQQDIEFIKEKLVNLVTICKKHHTAIRVGVNHGSLSERILYKHGDTLEGMAESAMEFIRIFHDLDFHDLVISLKASNVKVMVEANRLLEARMREDNCTFHLHLGVTEAGDAEDGRIKSAIGIGSLLAQGIGETIRVSLTEESELEIPVAKQIVIAADKHRYALNSKDGIFGRRKSFQVKGIGNAQHPIVIQSKDKKEQDKTDYIFSPSKNSLLNEKLHHEIKWLDLKDIPNDTIKEGDYFSFLSLKEWKPEIIKFLGDNPKVILVLEKNEQNKVQDIHDLIQNIHHFDLNNPIILRLFSSEENYETLMIESSIILGPILLNVGLDGIWIDSPHFDTNEIAFGILQATRLRISKTEYIACPSCGRTLFNIQEKLQDIKKNTQKYKGLKIGVMGCIVNGPGEMADADFGYVGAGPGKVDIYKGQEVIKKGVLEKDATQALLEIIEGR